MPEIFRFFGFVFFFYSREHDPLHVHVEGNGGRAKYDYDNDTQRFVLNYSDGIKTSDLKRIQRIIDDNSDVIVAAWNRHFAIDEDDQNYEDIPF